VFFWGGKRRKNNRPGDNGKIFDNFWQRFVTERGCGPPSKARKTGFLKILTCLILK
jgi:hypothetical protein